MTTEEQEKLLNAGIQAARAGNKAEARRMLEQVLEEDDSNEQAWLVLASVVDTPRERRICLENVLEINPDNERAKQALAMLKPSPPSGPTPTPTIRPIASPTAAARSVPAREAPITVPTKRAGETTEGAQVAWRRQRSTLGLNPTFVFAAVLALALIGVGLFLVTGTNVPTSDTPTPNPNETLVVVQPTLPGPTMTPTLMGTVVDILPQGDNPPTWTPTFTRTPPPTATLVPTLPPLSAYMLIFVGEGQGRAEPAVYSIQADGKNEKLLVGGDSKVFDPAMSPDGKKLAYVTLVDSHEQLVVSDADGKNPQPITKLGGSRVRTPAWAPNSARIVFVSDDSGNDELYAINPDGTNLTRLTNNRYADLSPSYSPDGSKIVFSYDSTGKQVPQIFVMDAEPRPGSQPQQLTQSGQNYSPTWSPDGKFMLFISTRTRSIPKVYIMRPDGSDERILTFDDADAQNRDPVWSADGSYVAFSSTRNGGVFNIFIITPDGKNVQQITNHKDNAYSPRFLRGF